MTASDPHGRATTRTPVAAEPSATPQPAEEPPAGAGPETQASGELVMEGVHRLVYRVPLGNSPWKGASEPLAVLVVFVDFDCPNTARMAPMLDRLLAAHPEELRVVYKAYPIPGHGFAPEAALAAAAARAQGLFWETHDLLLADPTRHGPEDLERLAERAGLDLERFRKALESETLAAGIADDVALGHRIGVTGTPSFVLNGRRFEGTVPYRTLDERVTAAIADGRTLVDRGVPRAEVYETLVRDGLELVPPRHFDTTPDEPPL